jgi:hypothetical protein
MAYEKLMDAAVQKRPGAVFHVTKDWILHNINEKGKAFV